MENNPHLIIVEDSLKLRVMLTEYFESKSFDVLSFENGADACDVIISRQPDIVLLDLMLPGDDGLTICRRIRTDYHGKIMVLTASDDDFDHVSALEIGADDFVNKPVKPRVLLARVRMLLRRGPVAQSPDAVITDDTISMGDLSLSYNRRFCRFCGEEILLTTSEFELLWLLASSAGQILSRDALMLAIRGITYDGLDRTIDNKIVALRKKFEQNPASPKRIMTIRGKGYLFVTENW